MLALLLALAAQPAIDPAVFAPGLDQIRSNLTATQSLMNRCDAIGVAVTRIQNRFAEKHATSAQPPSCIDLEIRSLAARSHPFGVAYRDAVQSARAQAVRLERLLRSPTVLPLLGKQDLQAAERMLKQVRDHARKYDEISSWHTMYVEPYLRRCGPTLEPSAGVPSSALVAEGERTDRAAIIAMGGGKVCPSGQPADGRVVIVEAQLACYSEHACECTPERVLPGAVIGF
jgi:hypothetical protein